MAKKPAKKLTVSIGDCDLYISEARVYPNVKWDGEAGTVIFLPGDKIFKAMPSKATKRGDR